MEPIPALVMIVRWPAVQTFKDVFVNWIIEITEGDDRIATKSYPAVSDQAYAESLA